MLPKPYTTFHKALTAILPAERIYTDPLRLLAYGTDASFYRLLPKLVVDAVCEEEVREILALANKSGIAVTFRAAGTSLSGQSVSDSVLLRLGHAWRGCSVSRDASRIRVQPGLIGAEANRILAPLGRKIGPDPASIDACMIGGIVANNSSGMCCGTSDNSYKTLISGRFIMGDGTLLDTGDGASREAFARSHSHILEGLVALRDEVAADKELCERIRRKFKIKNTMGYSINALVDFDDPFDILQHLMVGSEGTLGFIAEVTYKTVTEMPFKASSLMLFPSVPDACAASAVLGRQKPRMVDAVELMDRASLRSVQGQEGVPEFLAELGDTVCSLLVETRAASPEELKTRIDLILDSLKDVATVRPIAFTADPLEAANLWRIRKGILPSVGAMRPSGSASIIEDVAVPLEKLADAALDLQRIFKKHVYDAVLFGHALDGNLHFCFAQAFGDPASVRRYQAFMDDICRLITEKYDGSLKAEHGTGRNMAPYVEMEWGKTAYALMQRIKTLFDPHNLLNPGVIINPDAEAHLKGLKPLRPTDALIDKCTECGFCEPICPSRRLTLTPRQRIATWREIQGTADPARRDALMKAMAKSYTYQGRDTCAADGLCATRCPAGINTGAFIKRLRGLQASRPAKALAKGIQEHFAGTCRCLSTALDAADAVRSLVGDRFMQRGSDILRVLSLKKSPAWNRAMPRGGAKLPHLPQRPDNPLKVVYFPSCISRNMGADPAAPDARSEPQMALAVLAKAGYDVLFPKNLAALCCGMAFASKGFTAEAEAKARELSAALLEASDNGRYPVVTDTSPCMQHMMETLDPSLKLFEPVSFVLEELQDKLVFTRLPRRVAIHVTCSTRKMGLAGKLEELARLCAREVVVPVGTECCGFAGDRGFTHPELNQSALLDLRKQVCTCEAGYSTSRTCEIGLALHSGIPYYSILALVDEATTPPAM